MRILWCFWRKRVREREERECAIHYTKLHYEIHDVDVVVAVDDDDEDDADDDEMKAERERKVNSKIFWVKKPSQMHC